MGVNRRNYGRALEGESKKKQSLTKMHKAAVKKSKVKSKNVYQKAEENLKKLKAGKLGRIAKLKRTAKELVMGSRTYMPKSKEAARGKK